MLIALLLACPPTTDKADSCSVEVETLGLEGEALRMETGSVGLARTAAIGLNGSGTLALSVTGPFEIIDASGAVLSSVEAPAEVYARATGLGSGKVVLDGGPGCKASVALEGIDPQPIVGLPRTAAPFWQSTTSQWEGDVVSIALDPGVWPDRVGLGYDVYVVEARSAEEWAADATLVPEGDTPVEGTLTSGSLAPLALGSFGAKGETRAAYDVVVDFDRDGRLGPSDLIQGVGDDDGLNIFGDLSAPGPHGFDRAEVDGGVWKAERVWYPEDIASLGPRPLIVISHGNGHDYRWYDYLGEHFASWGYVVMSHENNTQPGIETASTTTLENTDWFLGNLDQVGEGELVGLVDDSRIGWIGHSRGGEGVVRALDRMVDGDFTPSNYGVEDIRFVSSIAPTVFNDVTVSDPHDTPYFLIAGTADGDVTGGVDCVPCQFYRIWQAALGPKVSAYVQGASHNDFNCCATQEGQGPSLIGRDEAQVLSRTYLLAVARVWLDDDAAMLDIFKKEYVGFTPLSVADTTRVSTMWLEAESGRTAILDDFQTEPSSTTASSGGAVTCTASDIVEDRLRDGDAQMAWTDSDPMNGMTQNAGPADQARGAVLSWGDGDAPSWEVAVPSALADTTRYRAISFATAQRSRHPETAAWSNELAFGVTLIDSSGVESTIDFADQASAAKPYERLGLGSGRGWANEFATVQIALRDFAVGSQIDLRNIAAVRLDFGAEHGATNGAIALDNVEFVQ